MMILLTLPIRLILWLFPSIGRRWNKVVEGPFQRTHQISWVNQNRWRGPLLLAVIMLTPFVVLFLYAALFQ